jgi:ABC-type antimicrobial peptide transport system permease subunit
LKRALRKHKAAFTALVVWHFVFFFPTLFMGRVVSPNDVFANFDPWSIVKPLDVQNSVINDPPTSYFTLMSLLKSRPGAFHWNPFVGSGIPGFGSSASAVLSPLIALPTLLLPLTWVYSGIVFLKLNVAFLFAYLWLREERLGRRGAAVGAIVFASAGPIAVRFLWQVTNATTLYPALLWIAVRAARGKRTPVWMVALIAFSYALSGFPATMAYGVYVAVAYFLVRVVVDGRRDPGTVWRRVVWAVTFDGAVMALAAGITLPSLVPMIQFIRRSGYLGMREDLSTRLFFPLHHFRLFLDPYRLGSHAYLHWMGDPALGVLNNDVESTVYAGLVALPLIVFGWLNGRAKSRFFFTAVLAVLLAGMFGFMPVARVLGLLPGLKYSWLTRLQVVVPLAVAYLAAAGAQLLTARRPKSLARRAEASRAVTFLRPAQAILAMALAALAATDLAVFAGRFHPYLTPAEAEIPPTPMTEYLQAQQRPFRIAPFFIYLWPNVSELIRVEDVRSHFSSEAKYRRMLARIDPSSWGGMSTILSFNSLKFNFDDPLVSMLGVRYYIEHRNIDIVKWTTFKNTVPGVAEVKGDHVVIAAGTSAARHVRVDAEPFYAVEISPSIEGEAGPNARLDVALIKGDRVVDARSWSRSDVTVMNKIYIPLRPYARAGESVVVRLRPVNMTISVLRGAADVAGDAPLYYGRVTTPVVFDRELPDGRLFRNLGEVPRFVAVSQLRKMTDDAFLATRDIDFAHEAIVTDPGVAVLPPASDAVVTLKRYEDARQELDVDAPAATFLASSEKLTPELRLTVDGRTVKPLEINMLFAGVPIPAGNHHVVFSRRIGRGWWPVSGACAFVLFGWMVVGGRLRRMRAKLRAIAFIRN